MESEWKKIQKDRFAADPFFKLLFDQNGSFNDKTDVKFIDELLKCGIDIIYRKYGSSFKDHKCIPEIF